MPTDQVITDQLTQFQQRDLFSMEAWSARGLNSSGDEMSKHLTLFFHDCAKELEKMVIAGHTTRQIKGVLKSALAQLDNRQFDREEKEFIVDIFQELAAIVGVDIRTTLSRWLYGTLLAVLVRVVSLLRPQRKYQVVLQPCTKCGTELETHIFRTDASITKASWEVVRCDRCQELNLLSDIDHVRECRFINFKWIESLPKDEYGSYEQALSRVEQIKYFRK